MQVVLDTSQIVLPIGFATRVPGEPDRPVFIDRLQDETLGSRCLSLISCRRQKQQKGE
jgi:hypothetical protein